MRSNSSVVRHFVTEVLNQGRIESTGEFFWEDVVERVPLPGQGPGISGLQDVLRGMRAAFPDMHWTVEERIAEGDKIKDTRIIMDALGLMTQLDGFPSPQS